MNARQPFVASRAQVDDEAVKPLPASRKVYVEGSRADIRVPMREITQTDTPVMGKDGEPGVEKNPALYVYDTSGPYTDPAVRIDIRAGLAPLRAQWILERNDTEALAGPTSRYGQERLADPKLAEMRFDLARKPRRAKPGMNVTQMHYARRGIVTPEMEFIAIRENQRVRPRRGRARPRDHPGEHQPSRERADDHRPQLPREDQREHRQLGGELVDRRGGRENDLVDPLGRRHGDGPLHRQEHPRDARVDHPQFAGADRDGADLSGARKGERQGRRADVGDLPRHARRAGRAGRRLLHHPRRRAAPLHPAHGEAHDRHRLARRLDHGEVVSRAPQGELPLHALRGDLRNHEGVRSSAS